MSRRIPAKKPTQDRLIAIHISLNTSTIDAIDREADRLGISRAEFVRKACLAQIPNPNKLQPE